MVEVTLFILLTFILSNDFVDLTSAVSPTTSAEDDHSPEKNHQKSQNLLPKGDQKKIPWTPKLRSDLIKIWYATNPEIKGHRTRLHQRWYTLHPRYSNVTPSHLRRYASAFVKGDRKDSEFKRIKWDDELNAELIELWDKTHSGSPKSSHLQNLYKEWKLRHPDLGTFSAKHLKYIADSLIEEDTQKRLARGEDNELLHSRMEFLKHKSKRIIWTPKLISDLMKCYDKMDYKGTILMEQWRRLQPDHADVTAKYLLKTVSRLRNKGKKVQLQSENDGNAQFMLPSDHQLLGEGTSQDHGATCSQTRLPNLSISKRKSVIRSYSENPYDEYNAIPSGTVHSSQSTKPNHLFQVPYLLQHDHQTNFSHIHQLEPMIQNKQTIEHQRSWRQTSHEGPIQESTLPKNNEDLDLELHLK